MGDTDLKPGGERGSGEFTLGLANLPSAGHYVAAPGWCMFGFIGLLIGVGFYVKPRHVPGAGHGTASATVRREPAGRHPDRRDTGPDPGRVAGTALLESRLTESVATFRESRTAESLTDKVVQFTVGAPTASSNGQG